MTKLKIPWQERFWKYVNKSTDCWEWTGNKSRKIHGYGTLQINKRPIGAHRLSWEIHYGKIPISLCVLHRCDNSICVNPKHLFLGTHRENAIDRTRKGRSAVGKKHGRYTHPETTSRGKKHAIAVAKGMGRL